MIDLRLAVQGSVFGDQPVKVKCPVHDDPSASMAVYADGHIHCFGCGFHRNDPDEALAVLTGQSIADARQALGNLERVQVMEETPRKPPTLAEAQMYHHYLIHSSRRGHRLDWLLGRGLTRESVTMALLGHDGLRFTIPVFAPSGELVTIRYRRDDCYLDNDSPKYSGTKGYNGLYLYGAQWLPPDCDEVMLCEGELDALCAMQAGMRAVSGTNGSGQCARTVEALCELLPNLSRVVIATDQDKAGCDAALDVAKALAQRNIVAHRWEWWDSKDCSEHLKLHAGQFNIIEGVWDGRHFARANNRSGRQPLQPPHEGGQVRL